MLKVIEVRKCIECPYIQATLIDTEGGETVLARCRKKRRKVTKRASGIPHWCPLETANFVDYRWR